MTSVRRHCHQHGVEFSARLRHCVIARLPSLLTGTSVSREIIQSYCVLGGVGGGGEGERVRGERERGLEVYRKVWKLLLLLLFSPLILFHVMGLVLRRRNDTEKNILFWYSDALPLRSLLLPRYRRPIITLVLVNTSSHSRKICMLKSDQH